MHMPTQGHHQECAVSFRESDYGLDAGQINPVWQTNANCRDAHPETMWPLPYATYLIDAARRICHGCPVRLQCLHDGAACGDWESIRGGLTGHERKSLHRDGLTPAQFPVWTPPPWQRACMRCSESFDVDQARPKRRLCPTCAEESFSPTKCTSKPCAGCGTKRVGTRRRGLCDTCYIRDRRARKALNDTEEKAYEPAAM
jgi:WhiB family redox-sensing transcriptional regulator